MFQACGGYSAQKKKGAAILPEIDMQGGVEWIRERLGFAADAVQERVLRSQSRCLLLKCTRQGGKSTVTAAKAVHRAATEAGSLSIVVSPSTRQSANSCEKRRAS